MVDRTFEMELDRQFGEAPTFPDCELFAARVTETLDRGWGFRGILIGGLGLAGGLIGAAQMLSSGLLVRLQAVSEHLDALTRSGIARAPVVRGLGNLVSMGSTMDMQVLWMSAALGALAVGLLVTRAIREI
jgi:hypothetical protein